MATLEAAVEPQLMTMEQYLRTSFRPDCDFVDDHIEERNLGETTHGLLQMEIGFWFWSRRKEWQVRVISELRTRVSSSRIRIPDITVAYDDAAIAERVRLTAPLIAIEAQTSVWANSRSWILGLQPSGICLLHWSYRQRKTYLRR